MTFHEYVQKRLGEEAGQVPSGFLDGTKIAQKVGIKKMRPKYAMPDLEVPSEDNPTNAKKVFGF